MDPLALSAWNSIFFPLALLSISAKYSPSLTSEEAPEIIVELSTKNFPLDITIELGFGITL